jgi:tetratricopeptide (TPR) repeat protein
MLQEYELGIKDYNSAIVLDPNSVDAYRNRAITYFNLEKYTLALNDAKKVKQLGHEIAPGYIETIEVNIRKKGQ